jgi:hypothetical protein
MDPLTRAQHIFTTAEKERFVNDPDHLFKLRHGLEDQMNKFSLAFVNGSTICDGMAEYTKANMLKRLKGAPDELVKKLIPEWLPGKPPHTQVNVALRAVAKISRLSTAHSW